MGSFLSGTVAGIIAKNTVHPYYLFYWLLRWDAEIATYDLGYPSLSAGDLGEIAIPMLDDNEQKRIIAEVTSAVAAHKEYKQQHRCIISHVRISEK